MKSTKKKMKKKTELEEMEEILFQQGFREVTKEELREMYRVPPARKAPVKKKTTVKRASAKKAKTK